MRELPVLSSDALCSSMYFSIQSKVWTDWLKINSFSFFWRHWRMISNSSVILWLASIWLLYSTLSATLQILSNLENLTNCQPKRNLWLQNHCPHLGLQPLNLWVRSSVHYHWGEKLHQKLLWSCCENWNPLLCPFAVASYVRWMFSKYLDGYTAT